MKDADSFAKLRFDEEAGTIEVLLLTCRVGSHYYPGNEPLHLAIKGRNEVWDLANPLFDLVRKDHEGAGVVVHRGARYLLTYGLWRALLDRLQDYLESVHLGIPTQVEIITKALD